MTDREKAIVMAYTGKCMLTGDKLQIFHKYVEDMMDRPVYTHEMAWLADEIKEKSKGDFIALCADDSRSENLNKWMAADVLNHWIGAEVLDKISAEIADIYCGQYCENPLTADAVREMALEIIDKYKAEGSE